ncbi:MAG: hypothetical protein GWP10_11255 [Nitrospiraceae bacterium]|nr:hypothetical protein [Nitrospiraceae bacterium]
MYIQNDAEQNEAINRMLNFTGLFCLIGERGTGKKFVLREFSVNIAKRGKTILIACENKKEETEMFFKENLSALIKEEGIIQICSIDEADLYLKEPEFDYAIVLIDSELKKTTLLSIAGKAKNVIFATTGYIPFEDRIPKANRIKLATEHRFGEHILHFVQPILSDTIKPTTDREIILKNKKAVTAGFMQIVNPEKFVQFVFVRGKNQNLGNKWNDEEATFILLAVKEFIKSGIERKNIGIIVSYERQKAYIEQLLKNSKISEIQVMLPEKSIEHDIIFVSFTDVHKIGGAFTDSTKLKIALTRAKSKLILVGNKKIIKTSKLLSRIL